MLPVLYSIVIGNPILFLSKPLCVWIEQGSELPQIGFGPNG